MDLGQQVLDVFINNKIEQLLLENNLVDRKLPPKEMEEAFKKLKDYVFATENKGVLEFKLQTSDGVTRTLFGLTIGKLEPLIVEDVIIPNLQERSVTMITTYILRSPINKPSKNNIIQN